MLAALRVDSVAFGGLRITVADAAALGALAAILLALARGKADASALEASGGTGVLLLLLPGLVLFVLAVAAARLVAPCLRVLEWAARRATPSVRVALLSLARSPGEVLLTVVFFVLSVGIAVFAIAYRATLVQGEREQARYAVPAPYVLQEDLGASRHGAAGAACRRATPRRRSFAIRVRQRHAAAATSRSLALPARCARAHRRLALGLLVADARRARRACFARVDAARCAGSRSRGTRPDAAVHDDGRPRRPDRDRRESARRLHAARPRRARPGRARADRRRAARGARRPDRRASPVVPARSRRIVAGHHAAGRRSPSTRHRRARSASARSSGAGSARTACASTAPCFRFVVNNAADAIIRPHEPLEGELVPGRRLARDRARRRAERNRAAARRRTASSPAKIVATTRYFPSVDGDVVVADLADVARGCEHARARRRDAVRALARRRGRRARALPLAGRRRSARGSASCASDPLARGAIALLLVTGDRRRSRSPRSACSSPSSATCATSAARSSTSRRRARRPPSCGGTCCCARPSSACSASPAASPRARSSARSSSPSSPSPPGRESALPPLALTFDWPLVAPQRSAALVARRRQLRRSRAARRAPMSARRGPRPLPALRDARRGRPSRCRA